MLAHRPRADLRVSIGKVDDETARRLLREHRGLVHSVVRKHATVAGRAFHPIDAEDLRTIAECAVLEAWVSYEPGDTSQETVPGAGFRAHARRVASWRVSDAVGRLRRAEPPSAHRGEAEDLPAYLNGAASDSVVYRRELWSWLHQAIGRLPLRQRIVVSEMLRGVSQVELSRELGISEGRMSQEYAAAVRTLRDLAVADGLDGFDLGS